MKPDLGSAERQLEQSGQRIDQDSELLLRTQDQRRQQLERIAEPQALPLLPPRHDPLEDKLVSISMSEADVGMFLWALAEQLELNLIVEPQVLAIDKKANLSLKKVTAREVLDNILRAFDLHGEISGSTLAVRMMEESVFDIDFIDANQAVSINTGGNVFGSQAGGEGGSNAIRGEFSLAGNSGKDSDPYKMLEASIAQIIGDQNEHAKKSEEEKPAFHLNRASGSLYVRARPSRMGAIRRLIEHNRRIFGRQVLIEAQLIDVTLDNNFAYGVDWTVLRKKIAATVGAPINVTNNVVSGALSPVLSIPGGRIGMLENGAGIGYFGDSFNVAVSALESFGDVKILSNPSVRVRNGSPAMLSVGTSIRYISSVKVTESNSLGGNSTSTEVDTDALFDGVVFGLVPRINADNSVELLLYPMQSSVEEGTLGLIDVATTQITLPRVNYKGVTTTLGVAHGDTIIIGGLIDQEVDSGDDKVPGLSGIPGLGALFKRTSQRKSTRELVIVLRVNIL